MLAQVRGDLRDQVRRRPEAVDAQVRGIAGHAKAPISDQARAEEWRDLEVRIAVRQAQACSAVRDHVLRKAAVDRVSGEQGVIAKVLPALAAVTAGSIRPPEPRNADPRTSGQVFDAGTGGAHPADHLVPGD